MHGVKRLRLRQRQMDTLLRDDAQASGLKFGVDRAGQVAGCCVWFDDRKRALNRHVYCPSGSWGDDHPG